MHQSYITPCFVLFVAIVCVHGEASIAVNFEGQKNGDTVRFNCSIGQAPPSNTIEFLVDSVTANNIRLFNGECYLTHKGSPCNPSECQCSRDGKRYYWVYNEAKETFTATCKAKINEDCSANTTIQFTDTSLTPHKISVTTCESSSNTSKAIVFKGTTLSFLSCTAFIILFKTG